MFDDRKNPGKAQTSEISLVRLEKQMRRKMSKEAISVGFWGSISVDPNKVYVSKSQADRSGRVLKGLRWP